MPAPDGSTEAAVFRVRGRCASRQRDHQGHGQETAVVSLDSGLSLHEKGVVAA